MSRRRGKWGSTIVPTRLLSGSLMALGLCLAGCGGVKGPDVNEAEVHFRRVATWYLRYAATTEANGKGPASVEKLKEYVKKLPAGERPDDLDAAFVSMRDHQPYVIVPNVGITPAGASAGGKPPGGMPPGGMPPGGGRPPAGMPPNGRPPAGMPPGGSAPAAGIGGGGAPKAIVYEQSGVAGNRMVAFVGGGFRECTPSEFQEHVAEK